MKRYWVKKIITKKEWYNDYSNRIGYDFLQKLGDEVEVGFLVANEIPSGCELLNDEEMRTLHLQRKAKNALPLPLEEKKENEDENMLETEE